MAGVGRKLGLALALFAGGCSGGGGGGDSSPPLSPPPPPPQAATPASRRPPGRSNRRETTASSRRGRRRSRGSPTTCSPARAAPARRAWAPSSTPARPATCDQPALRYHCIVSSRPSSSGRGVHPSSRRALSALKAHRAPTLMASPSRTSAPPARDGIGVSRYRAVVVPISCRDFAVGCVESARNTYESRGIQSNFAQVPISCPRHFACARVRPMRPLARLVRAYRTRSSLLTAPSAVTSGAAVPVAGALAQHTPGA